MNGRHDEPRRFRGTVAFYEKYRLGYPRRLIERVVALAGLTPGEAVLDLGCGPGSLALPFARAGLAVTAMDPEPEMLAAAEAAAAAARLHITLQQGGSSDLDSRMGPFRLAVIGRAFHWMDRAATLEALDRIVTPDGGVALFHDAHPPVAENGWFKVLCDIGDKYGRSAMPHIAERRAGGHRRYEPYLFASAFTQLDGLSVTVRLPITVDAIVGRAFSTSALSAERQGEGAPAFEADLRAGLAKLPGDGVFTEVAELVCLLARRETPP